MKYSVTVFCKDENEIDEAEAHWVGEKNYKRVYTSSVDWDAAHFHKDASGDYTRSTLVPQGTVHAVIFEVDVEQ